VTVVVVVTVTVVVVVVVVVVVLAIVVVTVTVDVSVTVTVVVMVMVALTVIVLVTVLVEWRCRQDRGPMRMLGSVVDGSRDPRVEMRVVGEMRSGGALAVPHWPRLGLESCRMTHVS
jgi:hypothetical protein